MPFIVTAKRRVVERIDDIERVTHEPLSRRAVATLEEATNVACAVVDAVFPPIGTLAWMRLRGSIDTLPESGGTVGPLPDGTTIDVEAVPWWELIRDIREPLPVPFTSDDILAAFNEQEAA